ncbi:MAG: DUF1800 family protein [Betaproteobacteria bacterium]
MVALAAALCAGWAQAALTEVYRFYHLDAGRHFYTASATERDAVLANYPRFAYEGVAFFAYPTQDPGTIPVYRFYNTGNGSHVYTASESEKASIQANLPIYAYEGVVFYAEASAASGAMPLYRLYNSKLGTHFFTTSGAEATTAVATWPWFANEGPVFFVRPGPGQPGSGANIAPSASLSVATTQVNVGETVNLSATAADPDGTVSKVDYFVGSTKIGTTTAAPHAMSYVATAAGTLIFSAVATDNAGLSGASNNVMVAVVLPGIGFPMPVPPASNTPPTVSMTTSATSVAVGTALTLTANASDADGSVSRVMFYNGPTQIAQDFSAPFTTTYTPAAAGTYMFSAVAVDNQNAQSSSNTIMVTVTAGAPGGPNTPPTVSLVTSTTNMSVGGTALLTASAADADGTVTKVEFYEGSNLIGTTTTSPFTSTFSPIAKGNYAFKSIATDNRGATTTSNTVTIFVSSTGGGNNPPTVSLAASPTTISAGVVSVLTATAADSDGTVSKVLFFDGASLLGQTTSPPFKFNFSSSAVGPHQLTAIAYDDKNATATSNTITVSVAASANKPPTVSLAASAASVVTGVVSTLTATAADADGTISKVVFYNGATMLGQVTTAPYTYAFQSSIVGTYTLTAVAFDNVNAQTTSNAVTVAVTAGGGGLNKPPTVTLAASATAVTVGTSTTLTAAAADSDGTIASVVFMNGTTVLATDAMSPYTYLFTPTVAGTTSITAVATDNLGAKTTSNAVSIVASTGTVATGQPRITLGVSSTLVTAPTTVTLTGTATATATGATVAKVSFYMNGAKLADVATSPYTFVASIPSAGTYNVQAQVTDSLGNVVSTLLQTVTAAVPSTINTTSADIWRLLNQATFGATQAEAARVNSLGISGWINDQLTKPISGYPDTKYNKIQLNSSTDCTNTMPGGGAYPADSPEALCFRDQLSLAGVQRDFFTNAVSGSDQLRQRVAWALSQILVTSANEPDLSFAHVMSRYQNLMFQEAFGNYETLLLKVTYNAAMGNYLDAVNNDRPSGTKVPNENYAREVLQLFTIGLSELNNDGTPILDAQGVPKQTYSEADIASFARVFTGYTYSNASNPATATAKTNTRYYGLPMIPYPTTTTVGHDPDIKVLLNGTTLVAGQTGKQDMDAAVRNAFMHPNTGPFVSKQLIQRLVTGNPSSAYVDRIAKVFNNNGSGVRGDLAAVVKAILLDSEARGGVKTASDFGQLKEPVLMVTNLIRALSGVTDGNGLEGQTSNLGQRPYYSPTVFNYFPPDATIPGTMVLGPEFAIHTTNSAVFRLNLVYNLVYAQILGVNTSIPAASGTRLYLAQFEALADTPAAMVSQINKVLAGGQFPAAEEATIVTAVNAVTISATPTAAERTARARMAVYLMASSYDYQVQR